jgi:hypothetical protein
MIINITENLACFAEVFIGFYFLNKFFSKKDIPGFKIKIITVLFFIIAFFANIFVSKTSNFEILSMLTLCLINFVYSIFAVDGKIQYKLLICIVNLTANFAVIIFTYNLFLFFSYKDAEIIYLNNFAMIIFMLMNIFLYFIIISLILSFKKSDKLKLTSIEWIVILTIFLITYISLLVLWQLSSDFQNSPLIISISTAIGITSVLVYFLFLKISNGNYIREEYNLLKLKNQTEMKIYSEISSQYEELNCLRHDLKHHFSYIIDCVNKNDKKSLMNYISEINSEYEP